MDSSNLAVAASLTKAIASIPDPRINPAFDFALFRRELELAREAVFDLHLKTPLSPEERRVHDRWADALCREILERAPAISEKPAEFYYAGNRYIPGLAEPQGPVVVPVAVEAEEGA